MTPVPAGSCGGTGVCCVLAPPGPVSTTSLCLPDGPAWGLCGEPAERTPGLQLPLLLFWDHWVRHAEGGGTRPPPGLLLAQRLGGWAREMQELCRARAPQGPCQGQVCSVSSECPLQLAGAQDEAWSLPWWARLPRGTSLLGSEWTACLAAGPGSQAEQTPQFIPRPRCEPWTLRHCGKASGRGLGPSARAVSRPTPRGPTASPRRPQGQWPPAGWPARGSQRKAGRGGAAMSCLVEPLAPGPWVLWAALERPLR